VICQWHIKCKKRMSPVRSLLGGIRLGLVLVAIGNMQALPSLASPLQADRIVIVKSQRVLEILRDGIVLKSYPIALGRHPIGSKRRLGDGRTPEGIYTVDGRNAQTVFHRELHISYPNAEDRDRAKAAHVNPGGQIFIHGMLPRFGHTDPVRFFHDWTNGCIAVGNIAIEEIWDAVPDGTVVEIRP